MMGVVLVNVLSAILWFCLFCGVHRVEGCIRTGAECIYRYGATLLKILIFLLNIKIIL